MHQNYDSKLMDHKVILLIPKFERKEHLLTRELDKMIRGCQQGEPEAQRAVYDHFRSGMFGVCLRYADNYDDAKDIFQEGFIKVFEKIGQFSFKGAFEGWIRRIMVNTAFEKYRRHIVMSPLVESTEKEKVEDDDEGGYYDISQEELLKYIQELSPRYRIVFNLYAIEGHTHREISEMLNISEGTSKSNLSRARVILKEKVQKHYMRSVKLL